MSVDFDCYEFNGAVHIDMATKNNAVQLGLILREDSIGFAWYVDGDRGTGRTTTGVGHHAIRELIEALKEPQP